MAITQTGAVKAMPYLVSNVMSLGTCFVYALVVLAVGYWLPQLIQSWTLMAVGAISYEIYLVHAFTLTRVENNVTALALFIVLTLATAIILHLLMKKGFSYVQFNNNHPHQE